jgi:hypothetical protein
MTIPSIKYLIDALHGDASIVQMTQRQWDIVIRQGRRGDVLARIGFAAKKNCYWNSIPKNAQIHLESEINLSIRQQRELRWEVEQVENALAPTGVPVVLLKGAAYTMAGLAAANGRLVSDIDILVPRQRLSDVESALMMGGWVSAAKDEYDQRYYRTWMHELPPMHHFRRGTIIDVHHAILPLTARLHPSSDKLLTAAQPLPGRPTLKVLSPIDMVLHSATHLFHEGELEKGLKGLVDLDALLLELKPYPERWPELVSRAHELELARPLFYAIRYTHKILGTELPNNFLVLLDRLPRAQPSLVVLLVMDSLFLRAMLPPHQSAEDNFTPMARWLLYLRGHFLRMPFTLLIPHLVRKMILSTFSKKGPM